MAYIDQKKYYTNDGVNPTDLNWGSYQYVSLTDIVNNFLLMYEQWLPFSVITLQQDKGCSFD